VLLEAFSATGLRAIRYAKEIPLLRFVLSSFVFRNCRQSSTHVFGYRYVIANDLSPSAVQAMQMNVEINRLGETAAVSDQDAESSAKARGKDGVPPQVRTAKVRINEGDAWCAHATFRSSWALTQCSALMYGCREERKRVDVVDLDPYGTAAPFIDAAVQCVNEGGRSLY
jgi:tRNA (guanine26-N2/guanine27-N2)-dimethyltransferase